MAKENKNLSVNRVVGDLLYTIASCYRYLGNEYRVKVMDYSAAARFVHGLDIDILLFAERPAGLNKLKDMDENIAQEIVEYLKTGKINTFEKLKKKVPVGLLDLMDVNGFGPNTLKIIYEQLHVNNREELIKAASSLRE
ncbi:hypothetical protein A4D02_21220 [Niastella koreensis]|uniref:Uncharacterized protein n=1 Tax=Niastella koreensis TaxID=354356 RepID=A0ABX3P141_9BACT|nr:hypothetical protein [Niastella koreensis]OQP52933.1 hypothetical protein A4D02_21220 [Niastella koreensis]